MKKWFQDYDFMLAWFELRDKRLGEIDFYFQSETNEQEYYIGYDSEHDEYWAGLCDIPDGCILKTAKDLFEAKIYGGKSIKDRWGDLVLLNIGYRVYDWEIPELFTGGDKR